MGNSVVVMIFLCLLNVTIISHLPFLTNAESCRSDGAHSPAINPSGTPAILTLNNFGRRRDGGSAAECDGKFHPLPQRVVALSTGWYSNGALCGRMIRIKARNGRSTVAKVVDECDSVSNCHRACKNNVVDASETVWKDLGLNTDDGEVGVIWSMA